ncbi:ABC transporter substrate-binding protein [Actinomyces qiguomingii]|uniref:ABC transporter substrate-binding protein n=1 Tax=Actinomyces qiguomingii TaxID=2057800 RepID=UPI001304CD05|nr:ABC transporter substrate-binding protein [Actinomyces qiguomingii]
MTDSAASRALSTHRLSRRAVLAGAAAGAATMLAACSPGGRSSAGSSAAADNASQSATESFPITIEHTYGSTTIEAEPTRIVAISTVDADVVVSLGVVPIGMPAVAAEGDAYPWTAEGLEALGASLGSQAAPKLYAQVDDRDVDAIAALQPDLILGVHSGMSREEYSRLSGVAPTLAYPADAVAYGASWEAVTVAVGRALGRSAAAEALVNTTTDVLASTITANPFLRGATYAAVALNASKPSITLYTASNTRSQVLGQLGLIPAPAVAKLVADAEEVAVDFPLADAAQLTADLLWAEVEDPTSVEAVEAQSRLAAIPAVADGTALFITDAVAAMSLAAASPLSLPWCCENHVPDVVSAIEAGRATASATASPTSSPGAGATAS